MSAVVSKSSRRIPCSDLGPNNTFPKFKFEFDEIEIFPEEDLADKFTQQMFRSGVVSLFPYTVQESYNRKQEDRDLECITLENDQLRVTVYPQFGGRVASIFDKVNQRELLFDNPCFQPANLAIRNAWFSGGIEWNGPLYGHSLLTCSQVYAARIPSPAGEGLRIYEFDRNLHTAWQVDLHLDNSAPKLWMHIKTFNLSDEDVDYYWWTNVAVPETDDTRVLASTKNAAVSHTPDQRICKCSFPDVYDFDGSYPSRYPSADSIFFDLDESKTPWIANVEKDGSGLVYTSTKELCGRKFFVWGSNPGGHRWMDFLSQDGKGRYIEIQGGLQPSQLQTLPMKPGACFEWTECISSLQINPDDAHHTDYFHACNAVQSLLEDQNTADTIQSQDTTFKEIAQQAVIENISTGSAWGRLFEQRSGKTIATGMCFDGTPTDAERVWEDALNGKSFSDSGPLGDWVNHPLWVSLLTEDVNAGRGHWKHHVLLAAAKIDSGDFEEARSALEQANAKQETSIAWRLLAVLNAREENSASELAAYKQAWALEQYADLAVVYSRALWKHGQTDDCIAFIDQLDEIMSKHERIQILKAEIAADAQDFDQVESILQQSFATIREGENTLTDLWYDIEIKKHEQTRGSALSPEEIKQFQKNHEPPRQIDFRMSIQES